MAENQRLKHEIAQQAEQIEKLGRLMEESAKPRDTSPRQRGGQQGSDTGSGMEEADAQAQDVAEELENKVAELRLAAAEKEELQGQVWELREQLEAAKADASGDKALASDDTGHGLKAQLEQVMEEREVLAGEVAGLRVTASAVEVIERDRAELDLRVSELADQLKHSERVRGGLEEEVGGLRQRVAALTAGGGERGYEDGDDVLDMLLDEVELMELRALERATLQESVALRTVDGSGNGMPSLKIAELAAELQQTKEKHTKVPKRTQTC